MTGPLEGGPKPRETIRIVPPPKTSGNPQEVLEGLALFDPKAMDLDVDEGSEKSGVTSQPSEGGSGPTPSRQERIMNALERLVSEKQMSREQFQKFQDKIGNKLLQESVMDKIELRIEARIQRHARQGIRETIGRTINVTELAKGVVAKLKALDKGGEIHLGQEVRDKEFYRALDWANYQSEVLLLRDFLIKHSEIKDQVFPDQESLDWAALEVVAERQRHEALARPDEDEFELGDLSVQDSKEAESEAEDAGEAQGY